MTLKIFRGAVGFSTRLTVYVIIRYIIITEIKSWKNFTFKYFSWTPHKYASNNTQLLRQFCFLDQLETQENAKFYYIHAAFFYHFLRFENSLSVNIKFSDNFIISRLGMQQRTLSFKMITGKNRSAWFLTYRTAFCGCIKIYTENNWYFSFENIHDL